MTEIFIATMVGVFQVILSIILIIRHNYKVATVSEIISALLMLLYMNGFSTEVNQNFWMYIVITLIEYLSVKIFLVVFMLITRYVSFYILKTAARKNKKVKSSTRRFVKAFFKSKYWPNLKLGIPAMANKYHAVTRVKFDEKGFPKFKVVYNVKLKRKYWHETRERHFYMANKVLYSDITANARLKTKFTKKQVNQLAKGLTPDGYTWHHHQDGGKLQLVDEKIHAKTYHIGGYTIWGSK